MSGRSAIGVAALGGASVDGDVTHLDGLAERAAKQLAGAADVHVPSEDGEAELGHPQGVADTAVDHEASEVTCLSGDSENLAPMPPIGAVDVGDEH